MRSFIVAFFLTAKSILRGNLGVTVLTISMLALANTNLLFVPSLIDGIVLSANDKLINTYSSDIIVQSSKDSPLINNVQELATEIKKIDGVTGVTYRNSIGAELTYEDNHINATIRGIPPERDREVFGIAKTVFEGSYLDSKDLDQILLGVELAGSDRPEIELYSNSLKKVHAGDKITVAYANGIKKQYTVKGVFYSEFIQTDVQAFVSEREFRSINPLTNNRATFINVKIGDNVQASDIISRIGQLKDGLKFQTWEDTAGIIRSMTTSFIMINGILTAINLLVAGITVFIVTYIDLAHKRRQIGIERAIGITPAAIAMSYVFRAIFYATLAMTLSTLLYIYVIIPLESAHPFRFPFGEVTLLVTRSLFARSALIVIGVSILAAFIPVWRTLRTRIMDAIWG